MRMGEAYKISEQNTRITEAANGLRSMAAHVCECCLFSSSCLQLWLRRATAASHCP